jgi:5-methylcytosine-specific restriction protein A
MTLIKEAFLEVLRNYKEETKQPIVKNPIALDIRKSLPDLIKHRTGIDESIYRIYGSAGQGNWAEIPWIAILDRDITTSTQEGIYICYLFSADMQKVYLSLAFGWTQYETEYGIKVGQDRILHDVRSLRSFIKSDTRNFETELIDLRSSRTLARGYELGTILNKEYYINDFPDDESFVKDFLELLNIYKEVKDLNYRKLSQADYEEVDAYQEVTISSAGVYDWNTAQKELARLGRKYENKPVAEKVKLAKTLARNPKFARLIKQAAEYKCQICGTKGFEKKNKELYAEAHHLDELAIARIDNPARMICVCPQCHRVIHYGSDEELNLRGKLRITY